MLFVFLVLVNGDVGDFHDDGSFTHGEPGARIFGGLRPSKLQRTGKNMKMCSYSTGSKINLTPFVALLLPGTFDVEPDNFSLVLENDLYSKPFACVGLHLIIYIPRISNMFIEFPNHFHDILIRVTFWEFWKNPWNSRFVCCRMAWRFHTAGYGKDSDNDLLDKEWVWIHYGTAARMKSVPLTRLLSEFPTLETSLKA